MATKRRGTPVAGKSIEILEAFTRRVAQSGYDGTNFSDIAEELGISKGTIVHHYGTKDRLLGALHESYMQRRLAEARLLLTRLSSPAERMAGLLFAFMLYQVHDRDATVAFQREVARLSAGEAADGGIRLRDEYLTMVREVVQAGIDEGQFREVDVPVQALLVFGSAQWAWAWFNPAGKETAEEVGAALVDLVLGSLMVRRPAVRKLADPQGPIVAAVKSCLITDTSAQTS